MPRPQRIKYENAFYHVMNRGRARQAIFQDERYYQTFLDTLAEAYQHFHCIIHAYCLMGNHYHLLLETPNANLSMHHAPYQRCL
jgi:putative transposase